MAKKPEFTNLQVKQDVAFIIRMKALTRSINVRDFTDFVLRCGLEQIEQEEAK